MKFVEEIKINYNKSRLIVGKIVELNVEDDIISKDGFINLNESQIATISGFVTVIHFQLKMKEKDTKNPKRFEKNLLTTKICPVCNFHLAGEKNGKKMGKCDLL